jgi:hypothetical protein
MSFSTLTLIYSLFSLRFTCRAFFRDISAVVFEDMRGLHTLTIRANRLMELSASLLHCLSRFKKLDLCMNPFDAHVVTSTEDLMESTFALPSLQEVRQKRVAC